MTPLLLKHALQKVYSFAFSTTILRFYISGIPTLDLHLIPYLEQGNSSLQVHLSTYVPYVDANAPLMYMPLVVGNSPTSNYSSENPIKAFDAFGSLPLYYEDQHDVAQPSRVWFAKRPVNGELKLVFTAHPGPDELSGAGARIDLREDQGGLIGSFWAIIPQIEPFESGTKLAIHASWDLSQIAEGSTSTWTWGDGLSTDHIGTMESAIDTLFAVGPLLSSKTSQIVLPNTREETFGMYWMGDAPYDPVSFFKNLSTLFTGMASFFNDSGSFYRIYIRRSTVLSYGGTAFARTFIFEYYSAFEYSFSDSIFLLAHEMVHNWARIGQCGSSSTLHSTSVSALTDPLCEDDTTWFDEGIAVYYGTLLPYRLGVCSAEQVTAELNSNAQAYYTNPDIGLSNQEAHEHAWSSFSVVRLPYYRGFMYLVKLDAEIRRASCGNRSLDDVVLELLTRRDAGEPFDIETFLSLVSNDQHAVVEYRNMASGKHLQIPAPDSMSSVGVTLRRVDMPPWELGFEISDEGNITEVKQGSHAGDAGLLVGDRLQWVSNLNWVADGLERNLTVMVRHLEGKLENITYWPRARHTVEGYQWI